MKSKLRKCHGCKVRYDCKHPTEKTDFACLKCINFKIEGGLNHCEKICYNYESNNKKHIIFNCKFSKRVNK